MAFLSVITIAFLVAVAALLLLGPLAPAFGVIDKPGDRKMHHADIPVVGGIAMTVGLVLAVMATGRLGHWQSVLLMLVVFMAALGALDDRFDVPLNARLFAQVVAALVLVSGTQSQVSSLGDLAGWGNLSLGYFAIPFTGVTAFALINMPLHFNGDIRAFMGDAGSTLFGFLLAGLSLGLIHPLQAVEVAPVTML